MYRTFPECDTVTGFCVWTEMTSGYWQIFWSKIGRYLGAEISLYLEILCILQHNREGKNCEKFGPCFFYPQRSYFHRKSRPSSIFELRVVVLASVTFEWCDHFIWFVYIWFVCALWIWIYPYYNVILVCYRNR